ncbi:MAG: transglutaminase domain-containing protein [Desulfotalea sp.]
MNKTLYFVATLLVLALPFTATAANEASGTITMEFDLSSQNSDKETKLWIPYPVSDTDQDITNISIKGDFAESAVYADNTYSNPMLYVRWDKGTTNRKVSFSFHATRQETIKKDFPAKEGSWEPADYSMYLQATSRGPITGQVKTLADEIVKGKTTVYDKTKAIYDWVCENMHRDPKTVGCGPGNVCLLLATPGGKCTDIHSVFVSLCRAAGVPAREVFGIRLGKKEQIDITKWQHCWAEFFLPGYGWVPVDPADVLKMMLKYDLELGDKKTNDFRNYFWGAWDQYRVKLAVGRDIELTPKQSGAPLNTFGYPYAEVGGEVIDWLNPSEFKYTITYKK